MVVFQIDQALVSKLVCTIGRGGLPGMSRDSKQRSCCDGVCEVHEIDSGGMARRVSNGSFTGGDGSAGEPGRPECLERLYEIYMIPERRDGALDILQRT